MINHIDPLLSSVADWWGWPCLGFTTFRVKVTPDTVPVVEVITKHVSCTKLLRIWLSHVIGYNFNWCISRVQLHCLVLIDPLHFKFCNNIQKHSPKARSSSHDTRMHDWVRRSVFGITNRIRLGGTLKQQWLYPYIMSCMHSFECVDASQGNVYNYYV